VLDDDNEDLTHGGQSLREIETFERPALDDDEDDGVLRGTATLFSIWLGICL